MAVPIIPGTQPAAVPVPAAPVAVCPPAPVLGRPPTPATPDIPPFEPALPLTRLPAVPPLVPLEPALAAEPPSFVPCGPDVLHVHAPTAAIATTTPNTREVMYESLV